MKQYAAHNLPLVSIVIPFYNVENYFAECLSSIAQQSYGIENIEVILIDDLGQDSSTEIAQDFLPFLGKNAKLIIHEHNKGLGGARNTGIEAATGEYIMFVDSDDYIDINTVQILVNVIQKDKSDIVIYNMKPFSELNKSYPLNPSFDLFRQMEGNSLKIHRYEFPKYPELAHSFSACNKLFKKSLFTSNKRFPEKQHHEDALLISSLLADTRAISLAKNVYYRYRQRESVSDKSITDTLFETKEHFFEHIQIVEGLQSISLKYPELEYMILWVSLRIMGTPLKNLLMGETSLSSKEEQEFYNRAKKALSHREIESTYGIGEKISKFAVDVAQIIVSSTTLEEAIKIYKKDYLTNKSSSIKRKFRKLKNNPKLFFKDMILNKTNFFRKPNR